MREKIIAKIFYLGRNRSTDEVLLLKIEDIDDAESMLNLSRCWGSNFRRLHTRRRGKSSNPIESEKKR